MTSMQFNVRPAGKAADTAVDVDVRHLIIAGWAGRDQAAIQAHIDELAAIGVAPPSTTPCFYRLAASLLTQAEHVQILGDTAGGEIECVLIDSPLGTLVAIGSDHTDREVETYGVAVSKQVCVKPVSRNAWLYADVAAHWDKLEMRSWLVRASGERHLYQTGGVATLLPPAVLWERLQTAAGAAAEQTGGAPSKSAMYGGTLAVEGHMATMQDGDTFELELCDPVLDRRISHRYTVATLPVVS